MDRTTRKRLTAKTAAWMCLLVGFLPAGCPPVDDLVDDLVDTTLPLDREANVAVIATVVKDVYGFQGRGRIIFLDAEEDALDTETLSQAGLLVESELGVRVLPESVADRSDLSLPVLTPVDPETGDIGISIRLGRFRLGDDGRLRVEVGTIRSGLDGRGFDYTLERASEGWVITSVTDTWVA